jgi:TrmH family RNA methyltransferase
VRGRRGEGPPEVESSNSFPPLPLSPLEEITSAANPTIAFVRSLGRRDRRAAEGAFVVEGVRAVRDGLESGAMPRLVLLRQGDEALADRLALQDQVPVRHVERRLFDRLSDVQTPQGILAVFPFPMLQPATDDAPPLVLILDRLRDPGNLGTLLRAAAGAGVSAVYLSPETVDPWNPKVVRAGMGAHFRVPIAALDDDTMADMHTRLPRRVVASAEADRPYDAIDWTGPTALVIGGEAEGVGAELRAWSTEEVGIPLAHDVESLNAAVAGAVILFEAARQRMREAGGGRRE